MCQFESPECTDQVSNTAEAVLLPHRFGGLSALLASVFLIFVPSSCFDLWRSTSKVDMITSQKCRSPSLQAIISNWETRYGADELI